MAVELKLLAAWPSPFPTRVKLALNVKGLSYEYVEEDLKNKSELLLASNPVHKKIPVLIHNGKPICESLIIVQYIDEYIDEAFEGPTILPSDPYERSTARFWGAFIDDKLFLALRKLLFLSKTEEEKEAAKEEASACMALLEEAFKKSSDGKGFFGGESIGYVDIVLGGLISWFKVTEKTTGFKVFDESKTPLLAEWADRFCAAEATHGVLQDVDKLTEFLLARLAAAAAAAK